MPTPPRPDHLTPVRVRWGRRSMPSLPDVDGQGAVQLREITGGLSVIVSGRNGAHTAAHLIRADAQRLAEQIQWLLGTPRPKEPTT